MDDLLDVLKKFRDLDDGWDTRGAKAPCRNAIYAARMFVRSYLREEDMPKIRAYVATTGYVVLAWLDFMDNEHKLVFDHEGFAALRESGE